MSTGLRRWSPRYRGEWTCAADTGCTRISGGERADGDADPWRSKSGFLSGGAQENLGDPGHIIRVVACVAGYRQDSAAEVN